MVVRMGGEETNPNPIQVLDMLSPPQRAIWHLSESYLWKRPLTFNSSQISNTVKNHQDHRTTENITCQHLNDRHCTLCCLVCMHSSSLKIRCSRTRKGRENSKYDQRYEMAPVQRTKQIQIFPTWKTSDQVGIKAICDKQSSVNSSG